MAEEPQRTKATKPAAKPRVTEPSRAIARDRAPARTPSAAIVRSRPAAGDGAPKVQRQQVPVTKPAQVASARAVDIAAAGVTHAGSPLPHLDRIQAAFGDHDVSGVRSMVGGEGGAAAQKLGASAYTVGERVAFKDSPDLTLASHEAAHVVQQRAGVELDGGVGRRGDVHERAADTVAQAVVAGRSAKPVLDALPTRADHAGVQKHTPPASIASHVITSAGTDQIAIGTSLRDVPMLIVLDSDADTAWVLDNTPGLLHQLAVDVTAMIHPTTGPIWETSSFIMGPRVRSLLEKDLAAYALDTTLGFPALKDVLDKRAAVFARQKVRLELEEYLGVDPGTVDWVTLLPTIHDEIAEMSGSSLEDSSKFDRVELVLLVLEHELEGSPKVVGGVVPANLSKDVWSFALYGSSFVFTDLDANKAFSEKLLGPYVTLIAGLEFVPSGFDLSRFEPSGVDQAESERHATIDKWVGWAAPELTTKYILDDWTSSGLDFRVYLAQMDLESKKKALLDYITTAYEQQARKDPAMLRAVMRMANDQARYKILARIVAGGRAAEKANRALPEKINDPDPTKYPELAELVGDPRGMYESAFYIAAANREVLNAVSAGAQVGPAFVESAMKLAANAKLGSTVGMAAFLLVLMAQFGELERVIADQRAKARAEIAARVDLSWETIKKIIDERGKSADEFLDKTWIPMLKKVADEWVTANYNEIKAFYDNFDTQVPQVAGRYRLAAWMIEDTANKLESGEVESSKLNGQTVTVKDVKELRDAVAVLRANAAKLESPWGRLEKLIELNKAIEAYSKVRENIADGTYKPENYGEDVVVEAKHRLGIGVFEYTTLWQQATRQVTVRENPFQAYTIAMWRVTNIIDNAIWELVKGFFRAALTIGSLLVPGVGGLILAAIDIGIGIYGAAKNIGEARRRLDLARLDTQLNIQGVTVADAEHALTMAWVSFVIELALAGLFTALAGSMVLKGIQKLRMPNLAKLAELDAALAAKLVEHMKGDLKLVDSLLGHFGGDANKLVEALAYVKDGKSLATLVGKVKDAELLGSLLISAGSDTELLSLMDKFKDLKQLDGLLGKANPAQLMTLYDLVKSETKVATLMGKLDVTQATRLAEAGLDVKQSLKLAEMGPEALQGFNKLADVDVAMAGASVKALTSEHATGDVGRLLGDVAASEERLQAASKVLADAQKAGTATAAEEAAVVEAKAAAEQARLRVDRAREVLSGESSLGKDVKVNIKVGPDGAVLEMPSVPLHDGTKVNMEIPLDPIKPVNGKVNAGGGDETPDATNLNPINPNSGGPLGSGINNHVKAGIEQMDLVFQPGSVTELSSSKLRYHDIDWNRAAKSAYKSMAPGGTFQLNIWTSSQKQVDSLIMAFKDAGFTGVASQMTFKGVTYESKVGVGYMIQGIR